MVINGKVNIFSYFLQKKMRSVIKVSTRSLTSSNTHWHTHLRSINVASVRRVFLTSVISTVTKEFIQERSLTFVKVVARDSTRRAL